MPWRDQLRLGWKVIRWLYWPSGWPVWTNVTIWICTAVILACIATGITWGIIGATVICGAVGFVMEKDSRL